MTRRIVVDRQLCEANAVCMKVVPEVFLVDESDKLHLLVERPPPELAARVANAVRRCPKSALSLVDD
jgi:ferredoxin